LIRAAYSLSRGVPAASLASAFLISSSMTVLNASKGWAPRNLRPLMKNDGVESTMNFSPSARSRLTLSADASASFFHLPRSSFSSRA
jgi:hypothetical protein